MPPLSRGVACLGRRRAGHSLPSTCRRLSTRDKLLRVSEEVRDALATGKPVVALETTIYTHGFPYPENVALASHLESLVRVNGGIPATIGILNGTARVGMDAEELIQLVSTAGSKDTWKLSRRDLGFIGGLGLRGRNLNGGTTIAGTMILAHLAGIKVFATGGLGGVHRGGEHSMDVSADLTELGRTPVAVISSGCKSFLDIPRTLEYLETQGVGVGTFADGRPGSVDFPAFFSRDSGVKSPQTIANEADAAAIVHAQFGYPIHSGLLFANPVPENAAMSKQEIDEIVAMAVSKAQDQGISGSANTPFVLKRIRELSKGASVTANKALIEANVVRGTKVAVELAKLELQERGILERPIAKPASLRTDRLVAENPITDQALETGGDEVISVEQRVDVLVAGSLACDSICDYAPFKMDFSQVSPALLTSNPSNITQSIGGVGRNVATAAHLAGASVILASAVADDVAGRFLIDRMTKNGFSTQYIRQLKCSDGARTAQYVAVNDVQKDLVLAMADMSILAHPSLESPAYWTSIVESTQPKWVVVDGNWAAPILRAIVSAGRARKIPIAFEPVSVEKAARLFDKDSSAVSSSSVVPEHAISLATPNVFELQAMYEAARSTSFFESEQWWTVIDNLGMSSAGSRTQLTALTNADLVDNGVPQQSIQLLPYIPNIVTKLGSKGSLLTTLLRAGDERLTSPEAAPYILTRSSDGNPTVGGIYMRLYPPATQVSQADIIGVNGVGDTMLGVIMAGLVGNKVKRLEDVIPVAQQAAVLTLKSTEAVSPEIDSMRGQL